MKYLVLSVLVLCIFSCNTDDTDELDCSNVLCAGRPPLILEIVNQDTQEQYFLDVPDDGPEGLTIISSFNNFQGELVFGAGYFINNGRIELFQLPDSAQIVLENEFDVTISSEVMTISVVDACCDTFEISNIATSTGEFQAIEEEGFVYRLAI